MGNDLTKEEIEFLLGKAKGKGPLPFPVEGEKIKLGPFPALEDVFRKSSRIFQGFLYSFLEKEISLKPLKPYIKRLDEILLDPRRHNLYILEAALGNGKEKWLLYVSEDGLKETLKESSAYLKNAPEGLLDALSEKVLDAFLKGVEGCWSSIYPFHISAIKGSQSPIPTHYSDDTPFMVAGIEVNSGNHTSTLKLLIPLFLVTSMGRAAKEMVFHGKDIPKRSTIPKTLESMDIEVTFVLGRKVAPLKELAKLGPGDTILLTESKKDEIYMEICGKRKFVFRKMSEKGGKFVLMLVGERKW